eukprot:TRINITY_DN68870_c0_g1_i1.p1 TRINITY_DN68870_c0_g1~~TRINITY_DN68870_c0_g1_i1.p1  ORF type:complete len:451 (-),score=51.91 TRINITY_DN68870_c0_g1_i1:194-1546(-)
MRPNVACHLWRDALVLLLLGVTVGLPTTVLPDAQNSAFSEPFLIAGIFVGIKGLLSTFFAPLAGVLADRTRGRKSLTVASLAFLSVPFAAILTAPWLWDQQSMAIEVWAFSVADTVFGLNCIPMSLCFSAVPDRLGNDEALLTSGYALLNFALSSGVGMGAVLGGIGDFTTCGRYGLIIALVNVAASVLLLPPTTHSAAGCNQQSLETSRELSFAQDVMTLLRNNVTLALLSFVVFLDFLAEQMLVSLLLLYMKREFDVSSLQLGSLLAIVGSTASVSLLVVVPLVQPRLGDLALMQVGLVTNIVSVGSFAFVQRFWQAYLPPLGCLLSFAVFPTANALAATAVPRSRVAMAQGIVAGSRTLAEGVSPIFFGWLFEIATNSSLHGWPFLVAAVCIGVALLASFRIPRLPRTCDLKDLGSEHQGDAPRGASLLSTEPRDERSAGLTRALRG